MLRKLLARLGRDAPPRRTYRQIVVQARQPAFYAGLGVPDTVSGRFDMIVLHAFLLFERLRRPEREAAADFAQEVFDEMFLDMDHNLREMGVSDVAVGKRVRRMSEVFYGRVAAYRAALDAGDDAALEDAFRRNIFAGKAPEGAPRALCLYVMEALELLRGIPEARLCRGEIAFPAPPPMEEES